MVRLILCVLLMVVVGLSTSAATVQKDLSQPLTFEDGMNESAAQAKKVLKAYSLMKASQKKFVDALKMDFKSNGVKRRELLYLARQEAETAKSLVVNVASLTKVPEAEIAIERIKDNSSVIAIFWHGDEIRWLPMTKQGMSDASEHIRISRELLPTVKADEMRRSLEKDIKRKEIAIEMFKRNIE